MKIRVGVFFGGKSVEHEVSVISAVQAMKNLNEEKYDIIPIYITKKGEFFTNAVMREIKAFEDVDLLLQKSQRVTFINYENKVVMTKYPAKKLGKNDISYIDVALPVTHGTNVEDGALQGYFKSLGLPFAGCDVLSSAIGMDKYVSKVLLRNGGFPVVDGYRYSFVNYKNPENVVNDIEKKLEYPIIIKPVNLGSSIGISKVNTKEELEVALEDAFSYASAIIAEPCVANLREINCSVLGDIEFAEASECEEPLNASDILNFHDKYEDGGKSSKAGMASLKRKIPANISDELRENIRKTAVESFKYLNCNGVARIDFLLNNQTQEFYINEFNTIPGSLSFYLWDKIGMKYNALLDRMIELALKRFRQESEITFSFDTNILSNAGLGSKGSKL